MNRKRFTPMTYIIIFLAVLGLTSSFFTNPRSFMGNLMIFISIAGLIIGLIYLFAFRRRDSQNELKKYRKAVKQSKKRQKEKEHLLTKNRQHKVRNISSKRSKKAPHLRVIDGKKATKKDPMSS